MFLSQEFRKDLSQKIASNWNQLRSSYLPQAASQTLRPSKQSYLDFIGDISEGKQSFLTRKTAQTLGIKLNDSTGRSISTSLLRSDIAKKGIDPTDFGYMRDFLLNQRKLSTGFFGGQSNILGLRPVLVDDALEKGVFKYLP